MAKVNSLKDMKQKDSPSISGQVDSLLASRMLFDLFVINTFEEAVVSLKNDDCIWGPVHTSIGQEAIAAGSVSALCTGDKFFGTHRSHHQFLSKTLQYYLPSGWDPGRDSLPDQSIMVIRRTLAEIMGFSEGFCGGRGGSMHLRCAEAGFLGSNAIVGGGIPLSVGTAFAEKFYKSGNIVVCFFGDGAMNQGSLHESMNLASLWNLPIIFFLENNKYAVGTAIKDASAVKDFCAFASSYGIEGYQVEGHDIIAIYDLMKTLSSKVRDGGKPCFVEAKCYRRYHHSGGEPGSAFKYRSKEEEDYWHNNEAVTNFPKLLIREEILTQNEIDHVKELASEVVDNAVDYCTFRDKPRRIKIDMLPSKDSLSLGVRSDERELQHISFNERVNFHDYSEIKYSDAISYATGRWLEKDPYTIVLGEEIANFGGGAYGATKGLPDKFPDRVLNTPISEAGFTGLGLGAAMSGMMAIIEIMFPDFTLVAADQVFNQIGKARHMYGNTTDIPLVLRTRIAIGCGYGGQHSMDPIGLYALFSGWRIVAPANSFDYIGLFNTSMQSNDPVLIIEHHALYGQKFPIPKDELDYFIEFGKARVMEEGNDVTVISYGYMSARVEKLAMEFKKREISVEIIDLRTVDLPSLDFETIGISLRKTGVAVVVEEAPTNHTIGAKIAAELSERYFDYLDSPVMRLTSQDVPNSVSRILESGAILDDDQILRMVTLAARRQWK